jgi:hypothetical protein
MLVGGERRGRSGDQGGAAAAGFAGGWCAAIAGRYQQRQAEQQRAGVGRHAPSLAQARRWPVEARRRVGGEQRQELAWPPAPRARTGRRQVTHRQRAARRRGGRCGRERCHSKLCSASCSPARTGTTIVVGALRAITSSGMTPPPGVARPPRWLPGASSSAPAAAGASSSAVQIVSRGAGAMPQNGPASWCQGSSVPPRAALVHSTARASRICADGASASSATSARTIGSSAGGSSHGRNASSRSSFSSLRYERDGPT